MVHCFSAVLNLSKLVSLAAVAYRGEFYLINAREHLTAEDDIFLEGHICFVPFLDVLFDPL